MNKDDWHQHVRTEIQKASFDKERLLDITESIIDFEEKDLVPEHISSDLFNLITLHNTDM